MAMAGIGGGGERESMGRVADAGVVGFAGVELRVASVATGKLRRAPGDDPVHRTERGERHVSAASMGSAVLGLPRRRNRSRLTGPPPI